MTDNLRLMCILAHPDDESLGMGGSLAKYASEGVETHVVCATRGERGRFGDATQSPGLDVVGKSREAELLAAARVLGVKEVSFLDYIDGDVDQAEPKEIIAKIVYHIRRVKPQVITTFGPDGGYGHPDHIAVSQFTGAAIVCAADGKYESDLKEKSSYEAHRVDKLYFMAWSPDKWAAYQSAFKDLKMTVDGVERMANPYPDWQITTRIDTTDHWETVWKAVQCHKTQLSIYSKLQNLPAEHHRALWGSQEFYRVFSTVNGGREPENDLFAGLA